MGLRMGYGLSSACTMPILDGLTMAYLKREKVGKIDVGGLSGYGEERLHERTIETSIHTLSHQTNNYQTIFQRSRPRTIPIHWSSYSLPYVLDAMATPSSFPLWP